MKVLKVLLLSCVFTFMACERPDAGDTPDYLLGEPTLAGAACEDSRAILSADGKEIILDLIEIKLQAGGPYRSLQRSSCTLAVPLTVPEDFQVAVVPAKLKGTAELKDSSELTVSLHTFLAGEKGVKAEQRIEKLGESEFEIGGFRDLDNIEFSKCGAEVVVRVNFSAFLKSKNIEAESLSSIQKLENETGGAFNLVFKSCKKK